MKPQVDSTSSPTGSGPNLPNVRLKTQLKRFLEVRGMTAAELSRKSGVSKQVISLWLSGAEPKRITQVKSVADALGSTVDALVFGSEDNGEPHETDSNGWISGVYEVRLRKINRQ